MDKMKVLLGLAAGGYWVYLVQSRKIDLKGWEYWGGLGVGAYWAWLALSSPADQQKAGNIPAQTPAPVTQPPAAPVNPQYPDGEPVPLLTEEEYYPDPNAPGQPVPPEDIPYNQA